MSQNYEYFTHYLAVFILLTRCCLLFIYKIIHKYIKYIHSHIKKKVLGKELFSLKRFSIPFLAKFLATFSFLFFFKEILHSYL